MVPTHSECNNEILVQHESLKIPVGCCFTNTVTKYWIMSSIVILASAQEGSCYTSSNSVFIHQLIKC